MQEARPSLGEGEGPSFRGSLLLTEGGCSVSGLVGRWDRNCASWEAGERAVWAGDLGAAPGLEAGVGQAEGGWPLAPRSRVPSGTRQPLCRHRQPIRLLGSKFLLTDSLRLPEVGVKEGSPWVRLPPQDLCCRQDISPPRLGQGYHIIQTGTLRLREVESLNQSRAAHFLVKTRF